MTGNGKQTTSKNGDDWEMVSGIVLTTLAKTNPLYPGCIRVNYKSPGESSKLVKLQWKLAAFGPFPVAEQNWWSWIGSWRLYTSNHSPKSDPILGGGEKNNPHMWLNAQNEHRHSIEQSKSNKNMPNS